jgi:hypothetical protein
LGGAALRRDLKREGEEGGQDEGGKRKMNMA